MAKKISPQEIEFFREYHVAARTWDGLVFGRLAVGRLIPLEGDRKIVFAKEPEEVNEHTYDNVLVVFKTEKGLHNWRLKHYPETIPVPKPEKLKFGAKGSSQNKSMYDFSYFQDAFTPKLRLKAQEWCESQTKHMYGDELMAWAKARMKKMDVHALDEESTSRFYENIEYEKIGKVYDYGMFLEECAIVCKFFYFGNGGEGIPNVISEGKNGSGKFIVSSIL